MFVFFVLIFCFRAWNRSGLFFPLTVYMLLHTETDNVTSLYKCHPGQKPLTRQRVLAHLETQQLSWALPKGGEEGHKSAWIKNVTLQIIIFPLFSC